MDIDDAMNELRAVERGEAPSGSVTVPITGPNSLLTPGGGDARTTNARAERCPCSGHTQSIDGTVVLEGVEQPAWVYGTHTTCNSCGHRVRFRVRMTDRPPWARILPHRVDGTPCR